MILRTIANTEEDLRRLCYGENVQDVICTTRPAMKRLRLAEYCIAPMLDHEELASEREARQC